MNEIDPTIFEREHVETMRRRKEWQRLYPNEEMSLYDYFQKCNLEEFTAYRKTIPIYTDEQIANLTEMIREADRLLWEKGGNTNTWVRECLIPALEKRGIKIKFDN